jgi:hypothetical protein
MMNKNALFSNLSDFENEATPDAAETDDDSDTAEELTAEEYHPTNYSRADICKDIVLMGAEKKNRPKKTVRFNLPPVEETRQTQVILRGRQRAVTSRGKANAKDCGFLDWGYGNTMWILDILLCV